MPNPTSMSTPQSEESRHEQRVEAGVFAVTACGLLVLLGAVSMMAGWQLAGISGWIWFVLATPQILVLGALAVDARRSVDLALLLLVASANLCGLALLITSLVTESSNKLSGGQLLLSGAVVWLTNVIVFGLVYWALDAGGPRMRIQFKGRPEPDFWFPQDDNDRLAQGPWYPRLGDYTYVALTNGIAFSPTDAMPLTRKAKALMSAESIISVGAILLVAARAVNVLGS